MRGLPYPSPFAVRHTPPSPPPSLPQTLLLSGADVGSLCRGVYARVARFGGASLLFLRGRHVVSHKTRGSPRVCVACCVAQSLQYGGRRRAVGPSCRFSSNGSASHEVVVAFLFFACVCARVCAPFCVHVCVPGSARCVCSPFRVRPRKRNRSVTKPRRSTSPPPFPPPLPPLSAENGNKRKESEAAWCAVTQV